MGHLSVASIQYTVELQLSRLIGMVSHLDTQKIWVSGFFFENRLP